MRNIGCQFKASRLLSKLLNFLPKLKPGALATRLLTKKRCEANIMFFK